jgi:hypothetical protein
MRYVLRPKTRQSEIVKTFRETFKILWRLLNRSGMSNLCEVKLAMLSSLDHVVQVRLSLFTYGWID